MALSFEYTAAELETQVNPQHEKSLLLSIRPNRDWVILTRIVMREVRVYIKFCRKCRKSVFLGVRHTSTIPIILNLYSYCGEQITKKTSVTLWKILGEGLVLDCADPPT